MGLKPKKCEEVPDGAHPCRERRDFHPLDQVLRDNGFQIHSRPRGEEAVWRKDNLLYTQTEAARLCPRQDVRRAAGLGDEAFREELA